jgi:hypothetical protein
MSRLLRLSDNQKSRIMLFYDKKNDNIKALAREFSVSEADIVAVLKEQGVYVEPVTPVLTEASVMEYLCQADKTTLARLFYTSGLVKLAEIANNLAKSEATS